MYVRVMILFCTRSLRYSTVVPWPNGGLPAPAKVDPTVSECIDCASHSLGRGVVDIGVAVAITLPNETAVADDALDDAIFKGAGGSAMFADELEFDDMKEDSKFCADDLRRTVGLCGISPAKWDMVWRMEWVPYYPGTWWPV